MTRIRWTLRAVSDLKAISSYIEQRRNLVAANRVCRIIYDAVEVLRRCPEIGKPGLEEGTRELVVPALAAYVVVYRILQADAVEIVESGTAHSSGKNNQPESRSSPRLVAGEAARRRKTCGRADFADLTRGRMAVLISHRFSTVRMADRILVWPMAKLWSKVRTSN